MAAHAVNHARTDAASASGPSYVIEDGERWPTKFERASATGTTEGLATQRKTTLADLHDLYTATMARIKCDAVAPAFAEGQQIGELGGQPVVVTAVLGSATSREAALGCAKSANDPRQGPAVVVRSIHRMPDGTPTVRFTALRACTPPDAVVDTDVAISRRVSPRFGDLTVTDIVFGTTRISPDDCTSFNPWLYLLE